MSKTWADAKKGDDVVIDGKTYRVRKVKRDGKLVKVTVERAGRSFTSHVKAKAAVQLVTTSSSKGVPLHDATGTQQRWAKPKEAAEVLGRGRPEVTEPPVAPGEDPWEEPRDRIERKLDAILGAKLIAESDGKGDGYYVPPVDVTTIAGHLVTFHPNTYDPAKDEVAMLAGHDHEHKMVLEGKAKLHVNHWHTKTRP